MRDLGDRSLLSASDLMRFTGCSHAIALDILHRRGEGLCLKQDGELAKLLRRRGNAHEAQYLATLKAAGRNVIEIPVSRDLAYDAKATADALVGGAEVVYRGAFVSGSWGGRAGFLERVNHRSELGDFSYEVTATKLSGRPNAKHALQLTVYSDMLAEVQGVEPERAHVWLGDGSLETILLKDCVHYARLARSRLEAFVEKPAPTRPIPCSDCSFCRWADHCSAAWRDEDSLFNVAGISRLEVMKLEAAGVATMAELSKLDRLVDGIATKPLTKLKVKARLQHERKFGDPSYRRLKLEAGNGYGLLPKPDEGDLFYCVERDPYFEGGIDYLHGIWRKGHHELFWGLERDNECEAVAGLMDFLYCRFKKPTNAHVYHYGADVIETLHDLVCRHGKKKQFFELLLRQKRFIDLHAVAKGGLVLSEPDYSIKSMERFYQADPENTSVVDGWSSIVYETWNEKRNQKTLKKIKKHNCARCISIQRLRDWLVLVRKDIPWPVPISDRELLTRRSHYDTGLLLEEEHSVSISDTDQGSENEKNLLNLRRFRSREVLGTWKILRDSMNKNEDELMQDFKALVGLEAIAPPKRVDCDLVRTYEFPDQATKLDVGGIVTAVVEGEIKENVVIDIMDAFERKVTVRPMWQKFENKTREVLNKKVELHPSLPIPSGAISSAICDIASDPSRFAAANDILLNRDPRFGAAVDAGVGEGVSTEGVIAAICAMSETMLPIQGPPGSGKTSLSVRAILSLLKDGRRIGVASGNHVAIRNMIVRCIDAGADSKCRIAHKIRKGDYGYPRGYRVHCATRNSDPALDGAQLVGGTAFFFSRPENALKFDWLFVDEAGQVSLADSIGMGRAARNIVLVGDPCQLPHVMVGEHPSPANLSCLDWVVGDNATMPRERGVFLQTTYRMHPSICRYVSAQFYGGRLDCDVRTNRQKVSNTPWPEAGVFWVPCEHEGNTQSANEEATAIRETIDGLLTGMWTNSEGEVRPIERKDIIVVAPFNAQAALLRRRLQGGIRIGTVDKFQGLEAAVSIVSMTASSLEESPRGMEFLLSRNRINVAISRARALSLVFGSNRLREAACKTLEQVQLVNTLCDLQVYEREG